MPPRPFLDGIGAVAEGAVVLGSLFVGVLPVEAGVGIGGVALPFQAAAGEGGLGGAKGTGPLPLASFPSAAALPSPLALKLGMRERGREGAGEMTFRDGEEEEGVVEVVMGVEVVGVVCG